VVDGEKPGVDNSMCKRVLGLLEPGDLRLRQVVKKRISSRVSVVVK